ncbi:NAD-dependent epimerase/dehydratase family protein [Rhizobium straminoryzae]|uniref:NAD-dependent epimerase/dehydratase family protein n=1 Tax=Rhizobium straminoryzae TaxID=1387186 RepID=A0A549T869_9HYPH|nr:NAD-dependent epimerase/dehydratase family protein [Rhizobium straminoryzae]TRL38072.1 NAD-dependent epimerase/dehydratase family protein [Rhizobium straminoryzae]
MQNQIALSQTEQPLALVLGATGGIGGAVARRLLQEGWRIRALNRKAAEAAAREPSFDWRQGDAMDAEAVRSAAQGARLIVHAVNPPGYRDWDKLVMPMLENTIAAARENGARILLPGTVYNYGPGSFPLIAETSPQKPLTRKGTIRVQMEQRLQAAAKEGVPVLIVRAGDFFGPGSANSWFAQGVVKPGMPLRSVGFVARPGIGHQWAYLPDVAETMVRLLSMPDRLGSFETFHMDGVWDHSGVQMAEAIERVVGHPLSHRRFPWWAVVLASPFVPLFREVLEMRYLWQRPVRLSNAKLRAFLGAEPQTPLDDALRATLRDLGCLPDETHGRAEGRTRAGKPVAGPV